MDNTNNKEITKTWVSGKNSCTLVIPRSVAIEYGLESPSHVIVERTPEGILIRKLDLQGGGKLLRSGDSSIKKKSISNRPITHYTCILCGQIISHHSRYTNRKDKPIPLDHTGKNYHDCRCLDYERNGLKQADFASNNHDNSTICKCKPGQTTLFEFINGEGAIT